MTTEAMCEKDARLRVEGLAILARVKAAFDKSPFLTIAEADQLVAESARLEEIIDDLGASLATQREVTHDED